MQFIFRSRKKFSTTYAIELFFSRPFHENFKFLKNCPNDFHEILQSHSTPKGAPACAMASKWYVWNVRNIAQISPKMAKKQPFLDFFPFSQKLSIRFERNFLQSFYTILWSFMCNFIKFVWLGCEKQPKLAQKWPKKVIFRFSQKLSIRFEHKFLQSFSTPYYGPMCAISINSYGSGIRASQKEKDLSRLLYRICGSGLKGQKISIPEVLI